MINVIIDINHKPRRENLAILPIDFRLLTKIFNPRYNRKKKGIPTAKKANIDSNQTGASVILSIIPFIPGI